MPGFAFAVFENVPKLTPLTMTLLNPRLWGSTMLTDPPPRPFPGGDRHDTAHQKVQDPDLAVVLFPTVESPSAYPLEPFLERQNSSWYLTAGTAPTPIPTQAPHPEDTPVI